MTHISFNSQSKATNFKPISDDNLVEYKLETICIEPFEQDKINSRNETRMSEKESPKEIESSNEMQVNDFQLNVMKLEKSKKFFVKLIGYDPIFFHIYDSKKKINEVIEDYLKAKNVNISSKIKETFSYRGKSINLDETIEKIEHLGWITSNYNY